MDINGIESLGKGCRKNHLYDGKNRKNLVKSRLMLHVLVMNGGFWITNQLRIQND